ncbi:hypothetical protein [Magnetospirillum sulfuroxidans]|uniref:Periplasmic protein TonB n=1 Tax=Magnetospirillum sulfuroxidans TaxID=611300 RepID=A0ABS5IA78_9PROT|nr:hypothetical protein [Magnetospirillum sulfuroxidans]MBR9971336.1 hypothetical protein [Magnetospirillum sulfuroxidans]
MTTTPDRALQTRVQSPPPRTRHLAPVLSVLLHLLLALAWMGFPLPDLPDPEPQAMTVDIVPPPPPPAASAPSKQQSAPAAKAGPDGKPIPQLAEGELAEKSTPVSETQSPKPAQPNPVAAVPAAKEKKPAPVNQNERDWVLSRVLRHWKPPSGLSAYDKADISLKVKVLADGHFSDIYDARRPWNPVEVFDGYQSLPPGAIQRRIIDAIYGAIRKSQPLALPPGLREKAPFDLRLDFRFKDAR